MTTDGKKSKESDIKEMESVIRDILSPYNDKDPEVEAWVLVEEEGWRRQITGSWSDYSSTMMECSNCKKHVPYHRYTFCPHCGSKNKT
jgi:hypothetical protein